MIAKTHKPGVEIDAWCTKCRMDLLHRIIAMDGDKVVRVECLTCRGHHNYRKPKAAPSEGKTRTARATGGASTRPPALSARRAAAADVERNREQTWAKAVLGQPEPSFKSYRASLTFELGELIRHGKFGDGYIVRVIDRQKVEVMFKDGPRTLAQALEG
jgi:hypothetical protein